MSLCDFLSVNDTHSNMYSIQVIQSKLVDGSHLLICNRVDLFNWTSIKNASIQCFGSKTSFKVSRTRHSYGISRLK